MRLWIMTCLLLAAGCGAAEEPPEIATARSIAELIGNATVQGDCDTIIEHTFDGIIQELGGRDEAIKVTQAALKQMKTQGVTLTSFELGSPGDLKREGDYTFVVVPTTIRLGNQSGEIVGEGFLLGISSDAGKTWKFVDGNGMTEDIRARVLPKLPANLELPEIKLVRK